MIKEIIQQLCIKFDHFCLYKPAVLAHHEGPVGPADAPPRVAPPELGLLGIDLEVAESGRSFWSLEAIV